MDTISALFAQQVNLTPQRVALSFEDQHLSYKQLDENANQLANYLSKKGVRQGTLVPICINRSFDMIIGILAILKAGAAYVPIDPEYPTERKRYILQDINANFILTNNDSLACLPADSKIIDANAQEIVEESIQLPTVIVNPTSLAYIIYTSGSTGNPKGVMIEHHAVCKYIASQTALFDVNSEDNVLQFSNFCFDASVEQIFIALLNGATLTLVDNHSIKDNEVFAKLLNQHKVTYLHATPGMLENLDPAALKSLKRVIAGGDVCRKELAQKWAAHVDFYNEYGPTEITVAATAYFCKADGLAGLNVIPIGKPLVNMEVYILDSDLQPVLNGESGELFIGGNRLARGYHNLQELTAKVFLPNPFRNNEKIYRTGDLGKFLPGGDILFLGRKDDQVKIRGYRIELGEIESKLNEVAEISQCIVLANPGTNGEKKLVAYYNSTAPVNQQRLIKFLQQKLPAHMIPAVFVPVQEMPLTSNGKIDKKALQLIKIDRPALNSIYKKPQGPLEESIYSLWSNYLEIEKIGIDDNFFELGGDSLMAQKVIAELKLAHPRLTITKLYQFPTISGLAKYLAKINPQQERVHTETLKSADIAVIGMAGRFPGANTIDELWTLLVEGKDTITFFSDETLDPSIPPLLTKDPAYVKARGIIEDAATFEPAFFGINPKLAELMDPQQRIFLEIAWEALEKCGHLPNRYQKRVGVFAGAGINSYYENNVLGYKDLIENQGRFQVISVNDKDFVASRTAYHLDLKGPAVNVNSACSTSLLAIAEAVNSLRAGQCEVALAGAASITSPINSGHLYQEGSMLSADGHCAPFNANSTGTVFSDGAGVVVLKSLVQAQQEGDHIYAVIKGVGISNDGGGKGSFTAPSSAGQAEAIAAAISDAKVSAKDISYIEAHGTATPIGDPIEFDGLLDAFGEQPIHQYCAIGSIKSNMGHLTHAAGVAGFIKTCLALHHKVIPASLHFDQPNPNIDFKDSPFYVNAKLNPWHDGQTPRLAGVSSFGVGGTNVHVILEHYENKQQATQKPAGFELIRWSAQSENSLTKFEHVLANDLVKHPDKSLANIAYTLHTARKAFKHRRFLVAETGNQFAELLIDQKLSGANANLLSETPAEIVFTFPGQGAQFVNMGLALYQNEPVYKAAVDHCAEILKEFLPEDIREIIFAPEQSGASSDKLKDTKFTQAALFVTEFALAQLWMSWGIEPTLLIGHSVGEYVAAHLAGVFSLTDGLKLVANRGLLISKLPSGSMLSVRQNVAEIKVLLSEELSIAAVNGPMLCVVSGPTDQIAGFAKLLDQKEIANKPLFTSHAFHSAMMDPVLADFKSVVQEVTLSKPNIKIISTVTGAVLTDEQAIDVNYWTTHLRNTVYFLAAVEKAMDVHAPLFLEIGPGTVTATLVKQIATFNKKKVKAIASLQADKDAQSSILSAIGNLWINGVDVNCDAYYTGQEIVDLPTYQFDKKKYWLSPKQIFNAPSAPEVQVQLAVNPLINEQKTMRIENLTQEVKQVLEDASGIEMNGIDTRQNFLELGFDSLLLTQVATSLKRKFNQPITFRKLNEEYANLDDLVNYLHINLPAEVINEVAAPPLTPYAPPAATVLNQALAFSPAMTQDHTALGLIAQQLNILTQQLLLLQGQQPAVQALAGLPAHQPAPVVQNANPSPILVVENGLSQEEKIEIQKPFGATPKIERQSSSITPGQAEFLKDLTERYNLRTAKSKAYTEESRPYMADPRVVSGFKPATKELVYPIVINKSKGSKLWDLDGNEYIDALNGFGSNMLGHQPDAVKEALHDQIEKGYEVGPQHELAAAVSKMICEFTGFDRAALCSTGSEAVLGCIRIARTVTGRSLIVSFTGAYHGIIDEVLVRGTKKLKSFPAAAGIMPEAVHNILVLEYGTAESLAIIAARGDEIAAVLVETVQSRRPEFVPVEFLKELRTLTKNSGSVLIFDEVITGFRFHPGGAQALFDIKADLASYGKVVGAGMPIGVIAGKRDLMDALDGGQWNYGDASIPEVGVTYFAGTFVRHPLALASAYASLKYMKERGPDLQKEVNEKGNYLAKVLNQAFEKRQLPIYVANYGSLWKVKYHQEIPYSELMFVLLREKGIHIIDGFPCFMTEATSAEDIEKMITAFKESMDAMIDIGFFPAAYQINEKFDPMAVVIEANSPPVSGAKLGKDKEGNPAWFIADPEKEGNYLQVGMN